MLSASFFSCSFSRAKELSSAINKKRWPHGQTVYGEKSYKHHQTSTFVGPLWILMVPWCPLTETRLLRESRTHHAHLQLFAMMFTILYHVAESIFNISPWPSSFCVSMSRCAASARFPRPSWWKRRGTQKSPQFSMVLSQGFALISQFFKRALKSLKMSKVSISGMWSILKRYLIVIFTRLPTHGDTATPRNSASEREAASSKRSRSRTTSPERVLNFFPQGSHFG